MYNLVIIQGSIEHKHELNLDVNIDTLRTVINRAVAGGTSLNLVVEHLSLVMSKKQVKKSIFVINQQKESKK